MAGPSRTFAAEARGTRHVELRGLHLGMEFNLSQGETASMDEQLRRHEAGHHSTNCSYFELVKAQVAAARAIVPGVRDFGYDDVSLVRVQEPSKRQDYFANVQKSLSGVVERFTSWQPAVVVIAGGAAFEGFQKLVWPELEWNGVVLKVRNPSRRGHMGSLRSWLEGYAAFAAHARPVAQTPGVTDWFALTPLGSASDGETRFKCERLRPPASARTHTIRTRATQATSTRLGKKGRTR